MGGSEHSFQKTEGRRNDWLIGVGADDSVEMMKNEDVETTWKRSYGKHGEDKFFILYLKHFECILSF